MDGKLLAQAREEKEDIRRRAVQTDRLRHAQAYAKEPALRELDRQIAALIPKAATAAAGGPAGLEALRRESLELQARRAELLVANGWPIDWLDGAWDCPRCRDTGYVEGRMCSCLKELYDQAQRRDLSQLMKLGTESFGTFDLGLYDDRPDPVSGVAPRTQMETVFGICYDYALDFGRRRENYLFRGGTGLGKTFLSACIAKEVAKQGFSVVYVTASEALGAYERQRFGRDEDTVARAEEQIRRMEGCDLLIVDDLGTEMVTEFTRSALYTLINTRLIGRKKTVVSTNLSAAQMGKLYTPQIVSRLEGEFQVLSFAGTDIRLLKKERGLD